MDGGYAGQEAEETIMSLDAGPGCEPSLDERVGSVMTIMSTLRDDAETQARSIVDAKILEAGEAANLVHCVCPPKKLSRGQERLWRELLIQSIQRQLCGYNVTV
jgi:hypothetical protein